MQTIGLITAMKQESQALLRLVRGCKPVRLGKLRGYSFNEEGRNCLLVESGMGIERAEAAARSILDVTRPDLLISFGIAGAVRADLQIGDVVIAEQTYTLQNNEIGPLMPLVRLSQSAWQTVEQVLLPWGANLLPGTAITTRGQQIIDLPPEIVHPVLEMETAGIIRVAKEMNIPLLVVRAVSDGPLAPIPLNLEEVMDENYNLRLGKSLLLAMRKPGLILKAIPMGRNTNKAANNAAVAVREILRQQEELEDV